MFKRRGKTLQRMNRTKYREGSRNSRKKHIEIWKDEQKCFFFRASSVEVPNDATFQNKDVGLIIEDLKVDEGWWKGPNKELFVQKSRLFGVKKLNGLHGYWLSSRIVGSGYKIINFKPHKSWFNSFRVEEIIEWKSWKGLKGYNMGIGLSFRVVGSDYKTINF